MSQILFRGTVINDRNTIGFTVPIVFGVAGIILSGILLLVIDYKWSAGEMTAIISGPIGLALLTWGLRGYYKERSDLFITKGNGNSFGVTLVNSKREKILELYSPFTIKCFYDVHHIKGNYHEYSHSIIFFNKENKPVLGLKSNGTNNLKIREGWRREEDGVFSGVEPVYFCSHILDAAKVLRGSMR